MSRARSPALCALKVLMAVLLLLVSTAPALAHVQEGQAQGFLFGLRHPLSGRDHVLAMIAVGLWGEVTLGRASMACAFPPILTFPRQGGRDRGYCSRAYLTGVLGPFEDIPVEDVPRIELDF